MKFLSKIIIIGALLAVSSSTSSRNQVKQEGGNIEPLTFPVIERPFQEVSIKLDEVNVAIYASHRELEELRELIEKKRIKDSLLIDKYVNN